MNVSNTCDASKNGYYYHLSNKSHESVPKDIMSIESIARDSGVLTLPWLIRKLVSGVLNSSKVQKARPDHNTKMSSIYS